MAKDPYRYFRIEAKDLLEGIGQGLLDLEKGTDQELVRRLLRQAHTLKGAARVVKRPDIGDLAHELEDLLSPYRSAGGPLERENADRALTLLDQMRDLVASLAEKPEVQVAQQQRQGDGVETEEQTVRISVRDLDRLLENALEAHAAATSVHREAQSVAELTTEAAKLLESLSTAKRAAGRTAVARAEKVAERLGRVPRSLERAEQTVTELAELRALLAELRLVPAQNLSGDLERAVRDAAQTLDKRAELRLSGAQTHVDAHVLSVLKNALVHIVRNSVAHGIEDPVRRTELGKPTAGSIDIAIERRGHRVSITCHDDGQGLDLSSLRTIAIERGLISSESAMMGESALAQLLLRGGLSTTRSVTGISGRGVGLDAVRHAVEALKGEVALDSVPGKGTTVRIQVPLSLSAMPALSLELDGEGVLVPLDNVRQALRISPKDISHDGKGERIVVEGQVIPFLPLERALNRATRAQSDNERPDAHSAVVIEAKGRLAAVGVDRLGGARDIVVRSIPGHAAAEPVVSGATFDDAGVPQLVLAPVALVQKAFEPVEVREQTGPPEVPRLLVIDDSLTTRMLEQSILESAGYDVDLAVSAEDALQKARKRRYGAFIVDVEMPGMSGFEFVATARADAELRDIPAILVTSRASVEDKRRGKDVGARAYIVKSEFDQAFLLDAIKGLVG